MFSCQGSFDNCRGFFGSYGIFSGKIGFCLLPLRFQRFHSLLGIVVRTSGEVVFDDLLFGAEKRLCAGSLEVAGGRDLLVGGDADLAALVLGGGQRQACRQSTI